MNLQESSFTNAKKNITFNLKENLIKCEDEVKLKLKSVTIDHQLTFNTHIANICEKASRQLNVLKRVGRYLSKLDRLTIYHSFILSNFYHWPVTCHFCSERNTKKMGKIQDMALKFINQDYNSTHGDLLEKYKLPSLN